MSTHLFRQGDVLLIRTDKAPTGQLAPRTDGQIVLALGEATGHRHAIRSERAALYVEERTDGAEADAVWSRANRILHVSGTREIELRHEDARGELTGEHGTVRVPPGQYLVIQQREWTGEDVQNVAD